MDVLVAWIDGTTTAFAEVTMVTPMANDGWVRLTYAESVGGYTMISPHQCKHIAVGT